MDSLLVDARHAWRSVRSSRATSLAAVALLTIGIGASITVFSVLDGILLRPLAYRDPERLVLVWNRFDAAAQRDGWLSYPEFADVRDRAGAFESVAALTDMSFNLTGAGSPERVQVVGASASIFDMLGTRPAAGRLFEAPDDRADAARVALLDHGFWLRRFAGDRSIVGRSIHLDGQAYEVIGILPSSFSIARLSSVFPDPVHVWTTIEPHVAPGLRSLRTANNLHVVARLASGVSAPQGDDAVRRLAAHLRAENPAVYTRPSWTLTAVAMQAHLTAQARPVLLLLMGAVVLLLLVACANVAGLLVTRASERAGEMAIRAALGAPRWRLARQQLIESVALSSIASGLGLILAWWCIAALLRLVPSSLPLTSQVAIDRRVALFAIGMAAFTALVFGAAPAVAARGGRLVDALGNGLRSTAGRASVRLRSALVAAQVALAVLLLVVTGLVVKSLLRLQNVDAGFDESRLVTFQASLPPAYATGADVASFVERLERALAQVPAVEQVGAVSQLPLSGAFLGSTFAPQERSADESARIGADLRSVTPRYFETMRIGHVAGRAFTGGDRHETRPVAIVDERMAARLWPGQPAVGRQLLWVRTGQVLDVVGVVKSVRHYGPQAEPRETVYRPVAQLPRPTLAWVVRTPASPAQVAGALRGAVAAVDADVPMDRLATMTELVDRSLGQPRFSAWLLVAFAACALVLALSGLYSVVAALVVQRRRELGIRIALGASSLGVMRLVAAQGAAAVGLGLALGIAASVVATRSLAALLYEISPLDAAVFVSVAAFVALTALAATVLPARRASRINPVSVLRS